MQYRQPTPSEVLQYQNASSWGPSNIPSPGANPYAGVAPAGPNFMDILRMLREQMAIKNQTQQWGQVAGDLRAAAAQPRVIPPPAYVEASAGRPAFLSALSGIDAAIKAATQAGR
jgi:hypothetical protein